MQRGRWRAGALGIEMAKLDNIIEGENWGMIEEPQCNRKGRVSTSAAGKQSSNFVQSKYNIFADTLR